MRIVCLLLAGTALAFSAPKNAPNQVTFNREILPLLYALAGVSPPVPTPGSEYPGYPLVASADATLFWFFGGLPLLIVLSWWCIRRPPSIDSSLMHEGGLS